MKIKNILLAVIAALMMTVVSVSAKDNSSDGVVKIVYPLDFPDVRRVHFMLNTLNNVVKYYQKSFKEYELNLVLYGPGLQYGMKGFKGTGFVGKPYLKHGGPTGKGVQGRLRDLQQLAGDNLKIYICGNTMEKKHVKKEQLLSGTEVTTAGVIKIIDLQRDGAAVIKIK